MYEGIHWIGRMDVLVMEAEVTLEKDLTEQEWEVKVQIVLI